MNEKLLIAEAGKLHQQAPLDQRVCSRLQPPAVLCWSLPNFNPQALSLFLTVPQRELLTVYLLLNREGNSPTSPTLITPSKKLIDLVVSCELSHRI